MLVTGLVRSGKMNLPIFIENSKFVVKISRFAPIEIGAITLGPVVLSRGEMSEDTKRHETIHWYQYKECYIVGFLVLYLLFWVRNLVLGYSGDQAYSNIPFEKEAYDNETDKNYLTNRKKHAWRDYL